MEFRSQNWREFRTWLLNGQRKIVEELSNEDITAKVSEIASKERAAKEKAEGHENMMK